MTSARVVLGQLCDSDAPDAAFGALAAAFQWAAESVAGEPGASRSLATRAIIGLDRALVNSEPLLAALPRLLGLAVPGPRVVDVLNQRRADLTDAAARVGALSVELTALLNIEERLTQQAAQADQLQARISDLRDLRARAGQLRHLHEQVEQVQRVTREASDLLAETDLALGQAANQLVQAAQPHLDVLGRQTVMSVRHLDDVTARLAELTQQRDARRTEVDDLTQRVSDVELELARADQRYADLAQAQETLAQAVRLRVDADREIAESIAAVVPATSSAAPDLDSVRDALVTVHETLGGIEKALAVAISVQEQHRSQTHTRRHLSMSAAGEGD